MSGRAAVPASLKKQIGKYLMAAKSFKKLSPVTSLYCKLYALEIAKTQFNNDTRAYILQLADDCIAEKDALNPTPEAAKSAIRATGSNIFKNIYPNESTLPAKEAAKGYRDAFVCFEILKHPNFKDSMTDGELEIYAQNGKYLTFKAASVLNPSIIKDDIPEPPPALQKLIENDMGGAGGADEISDDALMKELENMEMDNGGDPWASFNSGDNNNNNNDFDSQMAEAKQNELNNDKTDTNMNDFGDSNNNNNDNNYNNNNNNNNNMNNANPYYGNMGNPYYGGQQPSAPGGNDEGTMNSAAHNNNDDYSNNNNNNNGMNDDNNDDAGLGSLPSPPEKKPQAKPQPPKAQPSFNDLTKKLPTPKYADSEMHDPSNVASGVDYSSFSNGFSEESKSWANVKNGQKYQKECIKTLDQSIYCLMLGEPDFRGAADIAGKAQKMINLCRQSIGLKQINLPTKMPRDVPSDNDGGRTNDWWGKPIGTKKFFKLQELSFEAETRLKKVKRHVDRSEIPSMQTFVLLAEALSFLQPIAQIQPAWD